MKKVFITRIEMKPTEEAQAHYDDMIKKLRDYGKELELQYQNASIPLYYNAINDMQTKVEDIIFGIKERDEMNAVSDIQQLKEESLAAAERYEATDERVLTEEDFIDWATQRLMIRFASVILMIIWPDNPNK